MFLFKTRCIILFCFRYDCNFKKGREDQDNVTDDNDGITKKVVGTQERLEILETEI